VGRVLGLSLSTVMRAPKKEREGEREREEGYSSQSR